MFLFEQLSWRSGDKASERYEDRGDTENKIPYNYSVIVIKRLHLHL